MLQVKSFKFSDDQGINDLLSKFRLAEGASIFVSNSEIVVPFEDGLEMNVDQKRIAILEEKNKAMLSMDILTRGQMVTMKKVRGLEEQINALKANLAEPASTTKDTYDSKKEIEADIKRLEANLTQLQNAVIQTQAEITHQNLVVETCKELVESLIK